MNTVAQTSAISTAEREPARVGPRPFPDRPAEADKGRPAAAPVPPEEVLVRDARAGLSPSQMVERKLLSLLNGRPLPPNLAAGSGARRPARSPAG